MRETVTSLRTYFSLVAVLSCTSAFSTFVLTPRLRLEAAIAFALGVGFGIAGLRLPAMLAGSTAFIRAVLSGNIAFQAVRAARALLAGSGGSELLFPALYLAISAYLLANVVRLARESRVAASSASASTAV